MKFSRNQIIIISAVGVIIIFFALVLLGVIPGLQVQTKKQAQIQLNFWGVGESQGVYQPIIDQFQSLYAGVQIKYRKLDVGTYENDLINALAAGTGPDIFMIRNTWLPKHYNKISPLPKTAMNTATYSGQTGFFPDVVGQDFTSNGTIYAFPLSVDTMAMIYNKDIFNQSGIALAPTTWTELQNDIPMMEISDATGKISRAGAAIGGTNASVDNATDLLSLIMLQNGTQMVNKDFTQATFAQSTTNDFSPGLSALNFYTHFTNPINFDYTWNEGLRNSLDSFAAGSAAVIFGYNSQLVNIKTKNPLLNFAVAPMPTNSSKPVNYANYWGYTVSNKSAHSDMAWDFILFLTTVQANAQSYLDQTGKPPALNTLITKYQKDSSLGVFAEQALTAKSWPQIDSDQVDAIFSNMIGYVIRGEQSSQNALTQAQAQITQLMGAR